MKINPSNYFNRPVLYCLGIIYLLGIPGCKPKVSSVPQWSQLELSFEAQNQYKNPYTDQDVWAWFVNTQGDSLIRPAFWDGGNTWKIRFSPPDANMTWQWQLYCSTDDPGLNTKSGSLQSVPYEGENKLTKQGTLKMSPGKRNITFGDNTPFLMVGDTPWSMPYRATLEQTKMYAEDRQKKGFNTALLIAVQPDQNAVGPDQRNTVGGFARGFEDLKDGHLTKLNPAYFQTLDSMLAILYEKEIIPVLAPLAFGYGWKGAHALGASANAEEYSRFCKYLVARYGSRPACWLITLDGNGMAPGVEPAGETIEKWDAYRQPVGLHYNPCDDFLATWAVKDSSHCFHYNRTHQEKKWLDFQWAQTGHDGLHLYHKVERMHQNLPVKAVMNGEPTYEAMNEGKSGLGWWQGEDAWNQLMHGGTMGVIYGAACLWQWKITPDETGWEPWTNAPFSWRQALDFEGSRYVGHISRAFEGFDFTDMKVRKDLTDSGFGLLAKEGVFYIAYLPKGGEIDIKNVPDLPYYWFDPVKGVFVPTQYSGTRSSFKSPDKNQPWVLVLGKKK